MKHTQKTPTALNIHIAKQEKIKINISFNNMKKTKKSKKSKTL